MNNHNRSHHGAQNGRSYNGAMMALGNEGETIVMQWLEEHPTYVDLDDLRELRPLQKADVDAAVYSLDGTMVFLEIKTDTYLNRNGNVAFEFLRINHTCVPERGCTLGWTARTPAHYVIYYAKQEMSAYVFKTSTLRSVFQKYTMGQRPEKSDWFSSLGRLNMRWISTDNIKSTLAIMIPLKEFPADSYKIVDLSAYVVQ